MIERDDLAAWLRLLETSGVGRESVRKLLAAFGSAPAVFEAPIRHWRDAIKAPVAQALSKPPDDLPQLISTTWSWLQQSASPTRAVVCLGNPAYPAAWLQMADPPLMVYAQGNLALLSRPSMAIVGSRNATRQGLDNAQAFAESLSCSGLAVVSGLALGIDAVAHQGALKGSGSTIAIIGTGLDRVYPRQHIALAHQISEEGLMLSEYALGTPPLPAHFPQRNRLIAGLSMGTVVVEATVQSGSLITARLAMEAGREVFAIPGSIHSPQSRGCHALIKQGAKLVEQAQDILEELHWHRQSPASSRPITVEKPKALSPEAPPDALLQALGYDPIGLDALAARTGWSPQELSTRLLDYELNGVIARLPGQLFQRVART